MTEIDKRMRRMCVDDRATLRDILAAIDAGGEEIAFLLNDDQRVVRILTDGDVRRGLLAGHDLDRPVRDEVGSTRFQYIEATANHRADALDLMRAHGITQVPVLDPAGRLVGLHVIAEYIDGAPLPNWAVILAGGRGTRLGPITEQVPKPMVRVAGRPVLERLVLGLVGSGIRRIFLSVNYMSEVVKDFFGDGTAHGCVIEYLEEPHPLGTGGPLALLPDRPEHPILHLNGDLVGEFHFRDLLGFHAERGHAISIVVGLHRYVVPYGVVEHDGERVTSVREKPAHHWWINEGVYALSPHVIDYVPLGVDFPITELIQASLDRGDPVGAFEMDGEWRDIGRPEDLAAARGGVPLS